MTTPQESAPPERLCKTLGCIFKLNHFGDHSFGQGYASRPSESASPPELKPCPFCGAKPAVRQFGVNYFVECTGCHATTMSFEDAALAIQRWNRRSPSSDERPQREAATEYASGERLEQGVTFNAVDIWDAYERGAKDVAVHSGITDEEISRAADAYVKLVHLNRGKASPPATEADVRAVAFYVASSDYVTAAFNRIIGGRANV